MARKKEQDPLETYGEDILSSPRFRKAWHVKHHETETVAQHSIHVAREALRMGRALRKLGLSVDESGVVRGALLHDIGMTEDDVHDSPGVTKCYKHPSRGARIAEEEYGVNKEEANAIRRHMWPACIIPPVHKTGWLIIAADKYASVKEVTPKPVKKRFHAAGGFLKKLRKKGKA